MKRYASLLAGMSFVAVALVATPAQATNSGTTEGCTPGYWKQSQHFDSWQEAQPTQKFVTKFSMEPVGFVSADLTMLQALQGGGGSGLDGARKILARAAAAAWLNAAYDQGDHLAYPWRRQAVGEEGRPPLVETVRSALQGSDRDAMLSLAAQLDADNNLGCPLN